MRNVCIAILMILPCIEGFCNEKLITAGFDIGSHMKGLASIQIGYGFCTHFSAHAYMTMAFTHIIKKQSTLEKEHDLEFGKADIAYTDEFLSESLHIRYWTRGLMEGPFILTGISCKNIEPPSCEIGLGYRFKIWKGLGLETGYLLNLTEAIRGNKITGEGFTLGIYYTIKN